MASGTNAGVRTSPWASCSVPVRASEPRSRLRITNGVLIPLSLSSRPSVASQRKSAAPSDGGDGAEWNRMSAAARRARYSVSVVSLSVVSLSEPSIVFGASLTEIATLRGCFASGLGM